jgi:hypothetical protein
MNGSHATNPRELVGKGESVALWIVVRRLLVGLFSVVLGVLLPGPAQHLHAQSHTGEAVSLRASATGKLPAADKVVAGYLKAIGGRKQIATINDATYEWTIQLNEQPLGLAQTQTRLPASVRSQLTFGNGQIVSAANPRSAWTLGLDGKLRTLTDAEAAAARLQALLDASHLVNLKKNNVLARVVSVRDLETGPAYVVEFSLRNGARLRYLFSVATKLLLRVEDDARKTVMRLEDYRSVIACSPADSVSNQVTDKNVCPTGNILEPHRLRVNPDSSGELTFLLQRASYNQGISEMAFDPPVANETLDVATLLREVARNQDELEKRATEYSFLQKETDREINSKGELKKETVKVFEVFPVANREPIMKLISENGVPLSGARAEQEQQRVAAEFARAEREQDKDERRVQQRRAERERKAARGQDSADDDLDISEFLRACEFVSPRRERFHDRDAVVFDFRPRPGFKPSNRQEELITKLVGVVWIDPADKEVMRLEARLAEGFKMAGGLLVNLRPGAAVVMEQTRMLEGIWLPRLAQINLSVKVLLFGGGDYNKTIEWSDYKHFSGEVGDYKLDAPKSSAPVDKKP